MKRLFEDIGNHPREYFDIYVYIVGAYAMRVLAKDGHMVVAFLQGIILAGHLYSRHRDSLK